MYQRLTAKQNSNVEPPEERPIQPSEDRSSIRIGYLQYMHVIDLGTNLTR